MTNEQVQLILIILGILGSGIASWVGVKTAVARMEERLNNQREDIDRHDRQIARLEQKYFN